MPASCSTLTIKNYSTHFNNLVPDLSIILYNRFVLYIIYFVISFTIDHNRFITFGNAFYNGTNRRCNYTI